MMKRQINFLLLLCALSLAACKSTKEAAATTKTGGAAKAKVSRNVSTAGYKTTPAPGVISFAAANDRYSANGTFKAWKFTEIDMKDNDVESLKANLEIDLSSISEKSQKLTEHLKAWDYFDVAKYTTATIRIDNVRAKGNKYVADFTLKMRDAVQKMESEFEVIKEKPLRVKGSAMVDRGMFKIGVDNTKVPNMIKVDYETLVLK